MARRNPTYATVEIPVGRRDARPLIACDLVPDELQAIGLITVQWAHLEHCLYFRSCEIAAALRLAEPNDLRSLSFTRRLRAFRSLAKQLPDAERKKWGSSSDRIANAEGTRHNITHGL